MDGRVKRLLADPQAWTKGAFARDKAGEDTSEFWPTAYCFCLVGAVRRCYDMTEWLPVFGRLLRVIESLYGSMAVYEFNDRPETTHADVLRVVEEAGV